MSAEKKTSFLLPKDTYVYYTFLGNEGTGANKDNWKGLTVASVPVFTRYARETGAQIRGLKTVDDVNLLRLDDINPNLRLFGIYSLLYARAISQELRKSSVESFLQAIGEGAVQSERVSFIRKLVHFAGYDGTAQLLNTHNPSAGMLFSFFNPEENLAKSSLSIKRLTRKAIEAENQKPYQPYRW